MMKMAQSQEKRERMKEKEESGLLGRIKGGGMEEIKRKIEWCLKDYY